MKAFWRNFRRSAAKGFREETRLSFEGFGLFLLGCLIAVMGMLVNFSPLTVLGVIIVLVVGLLYFSSF